MNLDYVSVLERESIEFVAFLDQDPLLGRVICGDAGREEYVEFLRSTYHYVRWSGPLLAATAEGLRRHGGYPWLLALVDAKTAEESPHDCWVLRDLEACGEDTELVKASAAPVAVRAYVDWSLTMAEEGSPAFLGAAYTLELISMRRARMAAENLRARGVIPNINGAVSFLVGHGDADVGHIAELHDVLRRIDDERDQGAILLSASVTRALYPRFFNLAAGGGARAQRSADPSLARAA